MIASFDGSSAVIGEEWITVGEFEGESGSPIISG